MIVLDTNVISELMKPSPASRVESWLAARPSRSVYTTSITQAEILQGIMRLAKGRRRDALEAEATAVFEVDFAGRILPFSSDSAEPYARIVTDRRLAGRPIAQFDAQIAAIARNNGAAVATRNVDDFQGCGVPVENPWAT